MVEYYSIEDIDFHDAVIDKISLESNPDFMDTIQITMILCNQRRIRLTFQNCFFVGLELSTWILGDDSIRTWSFIPTKKQNDAIDKFIQKGFNLEKGKFQSINFNLNKTNSFVEITYQKVLINSF